jgi:CelD/BcsL family acetyltransferase involved in cellulose biosynthesis
MIRCEIINSGRRLEELETAWHALWLRSGAGIFQSYHWVNGWWTRGQPERLHIALAWDGDELVAVLPLAVLRWRGVRILQWAAQSVSDYCDGLASSEDTLRQLWAMVHRRGGFDVVRLKNVRPDAAIRPILRETVAPGEPDDACLRVISQWRQSGEGWFRSLNKKKRSNHARGERMLADMGKVSVRHILDHPPPALIARLSELKEQWRRANVLASTCDAAMLAALVAALDKIGALMIVVLECDGQVVAGSINAVQGNRLLAYFATYDPVVARASPGIMLMTHYIRWGLDHGITEIDFLRGEEVYKFEFANTVITLDAFLAGRTIAGQWVLRLYRLWEAARRLRRSSIKEDPKPAIGSAYFTEKGTPRGSARTKTAEGMAA